jgi:hypothetical protein
MDLSVPTAKRSVGPFEIETTSRNLALQATLLESLCDLRLAELPFAASMNCLHDTALALKPLQFFGKIGNLGLTHRQRFSGSRRVDESRLDTVEAALDLDSVLRCPVE